MAQNAFERGMPPRKSPHSAKSPLSSSPMGRDTPNPTTPSTRHRSGYTRVPSTSAANLGGLESSTPSHDEDTTDILAPNDAAGLGIAVESTQTPLKAHTVSVRRKPASTGRVQQEFQTANATEPLISPSSTGGFSGITYFGSPDDGTYYVGERTGGKQSLSSLRSSTQPSLAAKSDTGLISVQSRYDDWDPQQNCRSQRPVKQKMGHWVSTVVIILAIFSTVLSAIFLIIALRGPRYGRYISTNGALTASSAAFLTSFFAKLIEMTFVTVQVAFIGQALARRAFKRNLTRGITLAELSMRTWISQPGTLFTQWSTVRYAGISVLGVISLFAALSALLYTSAATALVQPMLKYPKWSPRVMRGAVISEFANPAYVAQSCQTPISSADDTDAGDTCVSLENAALGYHNYFAYIGLWTQIVDNGNGSSDLSMRPQGFALLNDNTSVTAPWIEQYTTNMTEIYETQGIIVNNVSMAMPHPGVIQAAQDPANGIIQPAELENLGVYNLIASVPSSVVHVLCTTMSQTNLTPFVIELSPDLNYTTNHGHIDPYLNGTPFDDVFRWGPQYGEMMYPPTFNELPIDYNTIVNGTTGIPWGRDSIYILGKGGPTDSEGNPTSDNYALCQLKVSQTPNCSTHYNASASGGTLQAICEDLNDDMRYLHSLKNATSGNFSISKDWPNIATPWASSIALNDGTFQGNSSNARLLTEFILTEPQLNAESPSMAEALAVMAGCTLLASAIDTPFVEFWNYSTPYPNILMDPQYQYFNTLIRAQQYASGGTEKYQHAFYIILFAVCFMNMAVLVYFLTHRDWYTDFSEPTNLFALAVNSPPSKHVAGSCGGGPIGEHFKIPWKLNEDGGHFFMESQEWAELGESSPRSVKRRYSPKFADMLMSPLKKPSSGNFEVMRGT